MGVARRPPDGGRQIFGFPFDLLEHPLTARVHDESAPMRALFERIAREAAVRIGGVIEQAAAKDVDQRGEIFLRDLFSGEIVRISEYRGRAAGGCRLDYDGLAHCCALVLTSLPRCDAILLNKFGKIEAEGGGFRCALSDALALGVPAVIGVPRRNLAAWREYAGDLARELDVVGG